MSEDAAETAGIDHEAWRALGGVAGGYGLLIVVLFLALFVVPFLLFLLL